MSTITNVAEREAVQVWEIDSAHTLVEFSTRHMMITTVKGRFGQVSGRIEMNEGDFAASSVEVEMVAESIDTRSDQRDGHLRSADFLDVEAHPVLRFRSTRVEGKPVKDGDRFRLVGDLTIRGVTREVVLDAVFEGRGTDPWGGLRASFSAETKVDRREFGLVWNQTLETGGVLVANDVRIQIEAQAVKGN